MYLPDWLNLDSLSIIQLAALLLSFVICVYLLQVPRKSLATFFLAGVFLGAFLFNTASFFEFAGPYYWQPRSLRMVLVTPVQRHWPVPRHGVSAPFCLSLPPFPAGRAERVQDRSRPFRGPERRRARSQRVQSFHPAMALQRSAALGHLLAGVLLQPGAAIPRGHTSSCSGRRRGSPGAAPGHSSTGSSDRRAAMPNQQGLWARSCSFPRWRSSRPWP